MSLLGIGTEAEAPAVPIGDKSVEAESEAAAIEDLLVAEDGELESKL